MLLSIFFIIAILVLVGIKWHLISLITNNGEHVSVCLLAIYVSLEKCLFKSFAHFLSWVVVLLLKCEILYVLNTFPYEIYALKISSSIQWVL